MNNYTHLSSDDEIRIETLANEGYGPTEIGRKINRDKSTVSRELKRIDKSKATVKWRDWSIKTGYKNAPKHKVQYTAKFAKKDRLIKSANSHQARKILKGSKVGICHICDMLTDDEKNWTPKQIAYRIKKGMVI
jgi:IS30 family transposase